jgi:hypothetical protein
MKEDDMEDLKQFIAATIYQANSDNANKDDIAKLRSEMHKGFKDVLSAVADTMENTNNFIFKQLDNHEARITKASQ